MSAKLFVLVALLSEFFCGFSQAFADAKLSADEAKIRTAQVSDPHYDLNLDISKDDKAFQGDVEIRFHWTASPKDLRIDFADGTVTTLRLNGQKVKYRANKEAVFLPAKSLKPGANHLAISYSHPYSKDGGGLYRFQDPLDKRIYLYTQFETFDANRMFPHFDQPDLKGVFTLTARAPKDWILVSTTREEKVRDEGETKVWSFAPTARISSYVFSLHAGPYKVWDDAAFRIPLRLMARQSVAQYVQVDEWFAWTRFGFDFFEKAFGTPYPFGKYDQLVVPDFNAGAMENVAAVTFNERFLVRGERSRSAEKRHASTILHEMAHMWFGDLVTMRWWDDLWLNESFATFAANWAIAAHPRYQDDAWVDAHGSKNWAYAADRLSTTHPIVTPVADTDVAGSNFDGITYGKGGAWLRLLAFRIGEENFKKGLRNYFQEHAFANATVADLVKALEGDQAGSLQNFSREWLQTKGLNTVRAEALCDGEVLRGIKVLQWSAPKPFRFRDHSMMLGIYNQPPETGSWKAADFVRIDYRGEETVWKSDKARPCPFLLVPNAQDQDYVKLSWAPDQWTTLRKEFLRMDDPLQRALVWDGAGWALEDGTMSLDATVAFIEDNLPKENDYAVLLSSNNLVDYRLQEFVLQLPDGERRRAIGRRLSQVFQTILEKKGLSKDIQLYALDHRIAFLGIAEDKEGLAALYEQKTFSIDQDRRWAILEELAALRDPRVKAWAAKENDDSDLSAKHMRAIDARLASLAEKKKLAENVLKQASSLSRVQVRTTLGNLFPLQQQAERIAFRTDYQKALPRVIKLPVDYVRDAYVLSLLPIACQEDDEKLFTELEKIALPAYVQQDIREKRDYNRLCQKIQAPAEKRAKLGLLR